MQTFVIRQRVSDFFKRFPPFDAVPESDLLELAATGKVKFHESEEYIFRQGDDSNQMIWMIQQGRVELLEEDSTGGQLRDVVGEGDLLGLECLLGDRRCLRSARTASDVLLYGIRRQQMEWLIARQPAVRRFVSAQFSVAGADVGRTSWLDAEPPPPDFLRARLTVVSPDASRDRTVSELIAANNGVVAVVDSSGRAAAILTPLDACAGAGQPAPAIGADLTTRAAVREMLRSRSAVVAITDNGAPDGRLEALLTASDLAWFCGHDPVGLVRAIRRAVSPAEIAPLLRQARKMVLAGLARPEDVADCCRIEAEVIDALTGACFHLARKSVLAAGIEPPAAPCCWLSFGAFARADQLDPGLPMIAAVYDEAAEGFQPQDSIYFAALTGEVMAWFHACGITGAEQSWPDGSHPCMPLSEWDRLFSDIIRNPLRKGGLYTRRELFDARLLSGDETVFEDLQARIAADFGQYGTAIPLLANDTLAHLPPLTFFRGLVLELDGTERDSFALGDAAIAPIVDAARVHAIASRRVGPANTLERLDAAALDYPGDEAVFRDAAEAFRIALYYQASLGSRIQPHRLGKFDQRILKTAFSAVHRFLDSTTRRFL